MFGKIGQDADSSDDYSPGDYSSYSASYDSDSPTDSYDNYDGG